MQRPAAVAVFGVLNIVFAMIGILGVLTLLILFMPQAASSGSQVV